MPTYIIEHLEPELFEWCIIEYENISKIAGKENLFFANIKNNKDKKILKKYGNVFSKSVAELKLNNLCMLDLNSEKTFSPEDKNKFQYFVFGGILGDNPPQHRTKELINKLKKNKIRFEIRNLGKEQMSTDTAVYVTKKILDGKKFDEIKFFDNLEIEINDNESVVLPYRYVLEDGRPLMSRKIIDYLKKKEGL